MSYQRYTPLRPDPPKHNKTSMYVIAVLVLVSLLLLLSLNIRDQIARVENQLVRIERNVK
jgi:hypothetical protein